MGGLDLAHGPPPTAMESALWYARGRPTPPLQQGRGRRDLFPNADDAAASPSPRRKDLPQLLRGEARHNIVHAGDDSTSGQTKSIYIGRLSLRSPSPPTAQRPPEGKEEQRRSTPSTPCKSRSSRASSTGAASRRGAYSAGSHAPPQSSPRRAARRRRARSACSSVEEIEKSPGTL
ncbi:hypothetical protein PVAP13_9KG314857 [Panicum virgatum]|uniref:Uncharacterized protein n=1 Tax=Panicum virgatum TaxID=38727 RepID=A0A8T0NRD0_PANVG|nr:hypothetical protein PVAP13_9KG314857 [Panicum virgatum]